MLQSLSPPRSPSSPRGPDGGAWGQHGPFSALEPTDDEPAEAHHRRARSRSPLRLRSRSTTTTTAAPGAKEAPRKGGGDDAVALQRLGRMRARAEAAFKKLTAQLPRKLDPAPPPPAFKPLTPAFDLGTLRRQVAALQVRFLSPNLKWTYSDVYGRSTRERYHDITQCYRRRSWRGTSTRRSSSPKTPSSGPPSAVPATPPTGALPKPRWPG